MRQLENKFNKRYNYPYVFLNDVPFTEEFIKETKKLTDAECKFGLIPKEHWSFPEFIDIEKAKNTRKAMKNVIYGASESYRHMCRFESGFFFQHPLLDEYEYYWRVEPDVDFYCDISFDPFEFMKTHKKKYAFTISILEVKETIPTLWDTTLKFMQEHPKLISPNNSLEFVSDDNGITYNMCHFWSNFEIASLDFFRSEAYLTYFEYLDKAGGFFYERWGDAPVHSIAVAMFLRPDEIHFFDEIGYRHDTFSHCPQNERLLERCECTAEKSVKLKDFSCSNRLLKLQYPELEETSYYAWTAFGSNI